MQEQLKSEGKCLFCGKTFSKTGISRHLATHLKAKVEVGESEFGKSFLVKIETPKKWGQTPYFLTLWVGGNCSMETLDQFLRCIWLECCGHMSAFRNPKERRNFGGMFDMVEAYEHLEQGNIDKYEQLTGKISKKSKAKDIFYKGLELEYEYDFGSSTELTITVIDEYPIKADSKIVLLSRNEPPPIMCEICNKAIATKICTACLSEDATIFCDKCAKQHAKTCEDFADYAAMPVVNSPRTGVCGYEGGTIDKERDRIFVSQK